MLEWLKPSMDDRKTTCSIVSVGNKKTCALVSRRGTKSPHGPAASSYSTSCLPQECVLHEDGECCCHFFWAHVAPQNIAKSSFVIYSRVTYLSFDCSVLLKLGLTLTRATTDGKEVPSPVEDTGVHDVDYLTKSLVRSLAPLQGQPPWSKHFHKSNISKLKKKNQTTGLQFKVSPHSA